MPAMCAAEDQCDAPRHAAAAGGASMDLAASLMTKERRPLSLRQTQIVEAAAVCVRRSGIHQASMVDIAKQAELSLQHVYRLFPGKDAIIEQVVFDHAERTVPEIAAYADRTCDLRALLSSIASIVKRTQRDAQRLGLMLEIRAEASRNPGVAEVLSGAERAVWLLVRGFVLEVHGLDVGGIGVDHMVEMFCTMLEGAAAQSCCRTDAAEAADRLMTNFVEVLVTCFERS